MGKIAFVFAGQGAQYPGMGQSLYTHSPAAKAVFDMAEGLRPGTIDQCFSASAQELGVTQNTQPCLFCVDLAAAAALAEKGVKADCAAGFSLGEIPALAFCGGLTHRQAFSLVVKRGELMQSAAQQTQGAMAAVLKLSNQAVEELAAKYDRVFPVNYNCPGQLVVAGERSQLESFAQDAAAIKGRVKILNVSGGFHSPFMESAAQGLQTVLADLPVQAPKIPLYANFTAKPYGDDGRALLVKQVSSPVRWQETVENMAADGVDTFIEVGAGKTLAGLIKKIDADLRVFSVGDRESLDAAAQALL